MRKAQEPAMPTMRKAQEPAMHKAQATSVKGN